MRVKLRERDGATIIDLSGSIRTNDDYTIFKETIQSALAAGKAKLILNFGEVSFINSSGLGRLALASKKAKEDDGILVIYNLSAELVELFSFTRLNVKIPVYKGEDEAIAALGLG